MGNYYFLEQGVAIVIDFDAEPHMIFTQRRKENTSRTSPPSASDARKVLPFAQGEDRLRFYGNDRNHFIS